MANPENMNALDHKNMKTGPDGLTYSYYTSPNLKAYVSSNLPTLLILHGFPDDAHFWSGLVPHLLKLPYPFIIPELLGLGDSDKPVQAHYYKFKNQACSLSEILDHEGVTGKVIPIGHDWGSAVAQRFYLYHRHRCVGLVLLSVAYMIPRAEPFNLEQANKVTEKYFGYPQFDYWHFLCASDGPGLLKENAQRFWEASNGHFPSPLPAENGRDIWMRKIFNTKNGMRDYVTNSGQYSNYTVPLKDYPHGEILRKRFVERVSRDGLEGAVNYYKIFVYNEVHEDEKNLCEKGEDGMKVTVPTLYIGHTGDWTCRTDLMGPAKAQGLVPDLEEHVVESGHWTMYEKPDENARIITEWLLKRFPAE